MALTNLSAHEDVHERAMGDIAMFCDNPTHSGPDWKGYQHAPPNPSPALTDSRWFQEYGPIRTRPLHSNVPVFPSPLVESLRRPRLSPAEGAVRARGRENERPKNNTVFVDVPRCGN